MLLSFIGAKKIIRTSRILNLCFGCALSLGLLNLAVAAEYNASPILDAAVENGDLPKVAARLPENPLIVQPTETLGKYGGTWRMAMRRGRDHALLIRTLGYENLLRWNPEWTGYTVNLAQSYNANSDATEFIFNLREGIRWSDGASFGVEDILFWYEHVVNNEVLSAGTDRWRFSGGKEMHVERRGPNSVAFIFEEPHSLFPQFLAGPEGAEPTSYPAHYLKKYHLDFNKNAEAEAISAGFKNWREQFVAMFGEPGTIDDKSRWLNNDLPTLNAWVLDSKYTIDEPLTAVRNPFYWKVDPAGNQLPYIDNLEIAVVKAKSDARAIARDGNIDMQLRAMASFSEKVVESPEKWPEINTFGAIDTDMNKSVIALNLNHPDPNLRKVFLNKDFRIALSYGINRGSIIRMAKENIGVPYQAAPRPESPFYNEKLAKQFLQYAPARAANMLDEIGLKVGPDGIRRLPNGKNISFFIDTVGEDRYDILKMVVNHWREIGIDATARNLDRNAFYDERALNAHDASAWGGDGGIAVIQSPIYYFPFTYESLHGVKWARWFANPNDPRAEEPIRPVRLQMELYQKLVNTRSEEERTSLMNDILTIAADEFYVFGISLPPVRYGIYRDGFKNVPAFMPAAWTYPTPAPTNPAQYYFE